MRLQCCMAARSSTVAGRMHTIFNMKSYFLNFRCETVLTQKDAKQKTPQKTKIKSYLQQKEEEEEYKEEDMFSSWFGGGDEGTGGDDYQLQNAVARERQRVADAKLIDEARARLQLEEVQQMKKNILELEREYIMSASTGALNKSVAAATAEVEVENEKLREEIESLTEKKPEPIVLNVKEMHEELSSWKVKAKKLEKEVKARTEEYEIAVEESNRVAEMWKQRTFDVCEPLSVIDNGEFRDAVEEAEELGISEDNNDEETTAQQMQERADEKIARAVERATERLYEIVQKQNEANEFIESLKGTIEHMKREADQHNEDVQKTLTTTLGAVQKNNAELSRDLKTRNEELSEAHRNLQIMRTALAGQDEKAQRRITQLQKDLLKEQQKKQSEHAGTPSASVILETGDEEVQNLSFELSKVTAKLRAAETKIKALEEDLDLAREQRENLIAQARQGNAGEATVSSPKASESKQLTMLRAERARLTRELSEAKVLLSNQNKRNQSTVGNSTSVISSAVSRASAGVGGGTDSDRKVLAQLRVQLRRSETEANDYKRRLEIAERRSATLMQSIASDRK
jgi:hypothetical protein